MKFNKKFFVYSNIIVSILVVLIISSIIFFKIQNYNDNRIYNLRKVDKTYRVSLLESYIDRVYKNNSILILGDSQPNGHRFPKDKIFSTLLEKKLNKNIINMAFQDSRILDNLYVLEYCKRKNYKFETIIFDVNQAHIKQSDFQRLDVNNILDYRFGLMKDMKSFIRIAFFPNPISISSEQISFQKEPDYFKMNSVTINSYLEKLEKMINISKDIGSDLHIYITPHPINAVIKNNEKDVDNLRKFRLEMLSFCKKHDIKCFEPNITKDKYFIDIVHFNSKGHQKMADILYEKLK